MESGHNNNNNNYVEQTYICVSAAAAAVCVYDIEENIGHTREIFRLNFILALAFDWNGAKKFCEPLTSRRFDF